MFEPRKYHIETRKEFERNLNLLAERMHKGQLSINKDIKGIDRMGNSFRNVRLLPNKRINFLTVNESIRCMANMMNNVSFNNENNEEE